MRVGSPIDSSRAICSAKSRDPSRTRPYSMCSPASPNMAMAGDALSPAAVHNSRSSSIRRETLR